MGKEALSTFTNYERALIDGAMPSRWRVWPVCPT